MSQRFDGAYAVYLTLNGAIVAFLLLPIAVVSSSRSIRRPISRSRPSA